MWSYLTSVSNEMEADIIAGLLQDAQITIQKRYPGAGNLKASYGIINGVDLWVEAFDLEEAREIISTLSTDTEEKVSFEQESSANYIDQNNEEMLANEANIPPQRKTLSKTILLCLFLILVVIIYGSAKFLYNL